MDRDINTPLPPCRLSTLNHYSHLLPAWKPLLGRRVGAVPQGSGPGGRGTVLGFPTGSYNGMPGVVWLWRSRQRKPSKGEFAIREGAPG